MLTYPTKINDWSKIIFDQKLSFEERTLLVFKFQNCENNVYQRFTDALGIAVPEGDAIDNIPLLPIEAFRDTVVKTGKWEKPELMFISSGTGGMSRSRHEIFSADLYRQSLLRGFRAFYPESDQDKLAILGYTPGYAANPHSSLIWMIRELISQDKTGLSRFLPLDKPIDEEEIERIVDSKKRLMLFGAAFGLLDLVDGKRTVLPDDTIILETGGMKTYKREITRSGLHHKLADGFGIPEHNIHSEYGMAEMLSQAYDRGSNGFETPHWLKVTIRNPDNPMELLQPGEEGLIGVIDLANVYSCSFLLTGDLGVMDKNNRFSVSGRWKTTNLRGCNFLIDRDG